MGFLFLKINCKLPYQSVNGICMLRKIRAVIIIFLTVVSSVYSQYNNNKFSIGIDGIYTTNAQLFLYPNSSDPVLRNKSIELNHILNPGIDIRYLLSEQVILGISAEYLNTKTDNVVLAFENNLIVTIPVNEEIKFIPVELSIYYLLPVSTDKFKFLMGGGGGIYLGSHKRIVGDSEGLTTSRDFSYGIHAIVSMDYLPLNFLSVRFEMKFRDPDFNLTNTYTKNPVRLGDRIVTLPQNIFNSRVNIDGLTFNLGAVFHFDI